MSLQYAASEEAITLPFSSTLTCTKKNIPDTSDNPFRYYIFSITTFFHHLDLLTARIKHILQTVFMKCAEELGISMEEYGYTSCLKEFTSITKSVTSKNDSAFKKLFKALDNASEMIVLKEWLEYLKKNQYKCNVDELKKIAKV